MSGQIRSPQPSTPQLLALIPAPPLNPATASPPADFETFWAAYPRKVGKGAARPAYVRALRKTDAGTILRAIKATRWDRREGLRYVPHPATWLNQERWLDEIDAPEDAFLSEIGLSGPELRAQGVDTRRAEREYIRRTLPP